MGTSQPDGTTGSACSELNFVNKLYKDAESLAIKKVKNKEELNLALIKNLTKEELKSFETKFIKLKKIVSQAGKIQE